MENTIQFVFLYLEYVDGFETVKPKLNEKLVSVGEVLQADNSLSSCVNFTFFAFVMAYNNKNVGGLFGCNFIFCVPNEHLWFSKFNIFKNIWIYPIRFYVFRK